MKISEDTLLCNGTYSSFWGINNGVIDFDSDDVSLTCDGTILIGDGGIGIYSENKNKTAIKNCELRDYNFGIHLYGASNSLIENNTLINGEIGIYIQDYESASYNNTIILNNLTGNEQKGIILENAVGSNVSYNSFYNNYEGDLVFFLWKRIGVL